MVLWFQRTLFIISPRNDCSSITKAHKRVDNLRIAIHTSENLKDFNLNEIAINHFQDLLSVFYRSRINKMKLMLMKMAQSCLKALNDI